MGEGSRGINRDYAKQRDYQRNKQRELSTSGREIGAIPPVGNPARRDACERDFRLSCETYFPELFTLAWSPDHLRNIAKIERAVLESELFAHAMPRGSGKTTICESACLWALLYGHREFIALLGPEEGLAVQMLDSIKGEIETNDRLLEDFPEVCFPVRCLEGITQRAAGQLLDGELTRLGWTTKAVTFPTVPGSPSSGSAVRVAGLTGQIRGMKHKRADGVAIRPDLVLIDDPQTDESARSPSQCAARERVLCGAVLGLAGPGRKIAGLMTGTVIRPGDLMDRILDREQFPQWRGERAKLVYEWPTAAARWEDYGKLWRDGAGGAKKATAYYRRHRAEMDVGAKVAWPERHDPDELSALQHAYNWLLRMRGSTQGEAAFWAEFQNEPLPEDVPDGDLLTVAEIVAKLNGHKKGAVPTECTRLTAFVDPHAKAHYWMVVGWDDAFTGYVLDYDTEPEQRSHYFTLREVRKTLAGAMPRAGREAQVYAGLERLVDRVVGREWRRADGAAMRVDRCMFDANWGEATDVVYQFCRQSAYAGVVVPCHGRYVGASSVPMGEYKRRPGERVGLNWRLPIVTGKRTIRHVVYDTNYWKSFVHARLAVPMGDPGCVSIWGRQAARHRMFAEHLTAEAPVRTEGRGRTVDEWQTPKGAAGRDNHWLDCIVGCAVGASMLGSRLPEAMGPKPQRSYRERYNHWQQKRRGAVSVRNRRRDS